MNKISDANKRTQLHKYTKYLVNEIVELMEGSREVVGDPLLLDAYMAILTDLVSSVLYRTMVDTVRPANQDALQQFEGLKFRLQEAIAAGFNQVVSTSRGDHIDHRCEIYAVQAETGRSLC